MKSPYTTYGDMSIGVWMMIFGVLMMLIGVGLLASWTRNVFFIPTGFFIFVLGIGVFATGMVGYTWWDRPPMPKIRCTKCYMLNYESAIRCQKCGAMLY